MSDPLDTPATPAPAPLTILLGCDTFAPDMNGAARFAERLASGLIDRGHQVHIVSPAAAKRAPNGGRGERDELHDGHTMRMHRLFSMRWPWHEWLRFAMPWTIDRNVGRILDRVKPDVVHFQSHFVVGRGLSRQATQRGIRVIATNHTMPENMIEFTAVPKFTHKTLIAWAWGDEAKILRRCDAVTTPTRRAADYLEEHTGLTGVHAIGNGVNVADYQADWTPRDERSAHRITFVGRLVGEKCIDVLLRAAAQLPTSIGGLPVLVEIVGEGDQRHSLELLAAQLGIADRVVFTGRVSDDELRRAYTRATMLAMPSTAELQSIVTMEAMSSALPIVGADAMALPHLIHHGENGYLFRPDDHADLAAKLEQILTLPDAEFVAMKKASLRLIAFHDLAWTLDAFESLYRGEPVQDPVTE